LPRRISRRFLAGSGTETDHRRASGGRLPIGAPGLTRPEAPADGGAGFEWSNRYLASSTIFGTGIGPARRANFGKLRPKPPGPSRIGSTGLGPRVSFVPAGRSSICTGSSSACRRPYRQSSAGGGQKENIKNDPDKSPNFGRMNRAGDWRPEGAGRWIGVLGRVVSGRLDRNDGRPRRARLFRRARRAPTLVPGDYPPPTVSGFGPPVCSTTAEPRRRRSIRARFFRRWAAARRWFLAEQSLRIGAKREGLAEAPRHSGRRTTRARIDNNRLCLSCTASARRRAEEFASLVF